MMTSRSKRPPKAHRALVLRTCDAQLRGHGGFQWPAHGWVEAPDWDPRPECGQGLHGGTATAGNGGTATAGDWGAIAIRWWDDARQTYRIRVGEIGEGGLLPGVAYRVEGGEFVAVVPK